MNSNIKHIATRYDLSTSHGYQFNPHFFCGAGFSIHTERFNDRDYIINFPLFIEGRTDWTFGKVPLFFDLRLGCNIFGQVDTDYTPLFIIPAIGYRLDWGRRTCANFSLGVSLHGNKEYDEFSFHFLALPSIRVGIEF